ncbi:WhiB family transcriptional regulator [Saccharopolyspora sp. NPDC049426]|uniref:WhiB family transcriptional regulator n=1 Tax=Saccharopolyspora sp. NPDC049426 TaxID=3155652 RepID=UPI00341C31C2
MRDATIDELHEYIEYRGKCTKPVKPATRRRRDPWHDKTIARGRWSHDEQRRRAQRACHGCPVQSECLRVALALEAKAGECWGYWGGTIPPDRARMLAMNSVNQGFDVEIDDGDRSLIG